MILLMILLPALASLTACSGGGGDGFIADGGIGGTGISIGSISAFGSIFVNDTEFDTTAAEVVVNGMSMGSGDSVVRQFLARGMVVRVEGKIRNDGSGTADRIVFNDHVQGPVESIETLDKLTQKLIVAGQPVIVNEQTNFENTSLDLIEIGNVLEVSGMVDGEGLIRATFVAKKADSPLPDTEVGVRGHICDVDTLLETFCINLLLVDYSLVDVRRLPDGFPANGQLVEVKGTLDGNSVLIADHISLVDDLGVDNAERAEIEGIVTEFFSLSDFSIGNVAVHTDGQTSFEGLDPADVAIDSRLAVKGPLIDGVLQADKVIARTTVKLKSTVTATDLTEKTITLDGLEDTIVRVNDLTRFLGKADGLDEIQIDDHAAVFGRLLPDNSVLASKVMINPASDDKVLLKGPVTSFSSPQLDIVGTTVDTTIVPDDGFATSDGGPLTRDEFLNTVGNGDIVNARGRFDGTAVRWKAIEFESGQ